MDKSVATIDFDNLKISDYSQRYIRRMLPVLDYYWDIYDNCLDQILSSVDKPLEKIVLVDYGGGHGFLSFRAKQRGVGHVIYVDFNPKAVQTVNSIAEELGYGPDVVLLGDSKILRDWCDTESEKPDVLMGMDVIEHIYCLDDFFADVNAINPNIHMIFTTGSNPFNMMKCRRLRKTMHQDEIQFSQLRREFILKHYPNMDVSNVDSWALNTRGLVYDDILRAIDTETPNLLKDRHNTCNPETGSWTERILSIEEYCAILLPYNWTLSVSKGFYNIHKQGIKGKLFLPLLNHCVRMSKGIRWSPYIILNIS